MEYINYLSYTLSFIFLIFCGQAVFKEYRYRKATKPHRVYQKQARELRALGMKPFWFNNKKTEIWAYTFKEAQQKFNTSRNHQSKSSKPKS